MSKISNRSVATFKHVVQSKYIFQDTCRHWLGVLFSFVASQSLIFNFAEH